MVVDCENSDPYKLCATLNGLEPDRLEKISKVILFDDVHTVDAWRVLESHTPLPVEHVMIERIKQNKSPGGHPPGHRGVPRVLPEPG